MSLLLLLRSEAGGPTVPVWVSPADGAGMGTLPVLVFTMIDTGAAMHFWMELDTVNSFDGGDLRTIRSDLDQTGWEYYNGATWAAVPAGGVSNTYAANDARHTVQSALSVDTWYRRVKAGA